MLALDQGLKSLARRSLLIACAMLQEADPSAVCATRKTKQDMVIRKLWLHVLGLLAADDDPRTDWAIVQDPYDPIAAHAPRRLVTQVQIAKITGLDRGTIAKDQADVARWRLRNPEVDRACIAITDAMADLWYSIGASEGWIEELLFELEDDYQTARAERRKQPPKSTPDPAPAPSPHPSMAARIRAIASGGPSR